MRHIAAPALTARRDTLKSKLATRRTLSLCCWSGQRTKTCQPAPFTHTSQRTEYHWFVSNTAASFQVNYRQVYRRLRLTMQVGDLVELSATGRKILYCRNLRKKQGIVVEMSDQGMYPILVFWFGAGQHSHRRPTLKLLSKREKR